MFESWSKYNPRRTAIRENRPDVGEFWRRFRERGGSVSVAIAIAFCAALAALFMFRQDVSRYRPGQFVPHDITARVSFRFFDQDLHDRQINLARDYAPHVYRKKAGDVWSVLQTELLALPDRVHNLKVDQLDVPLNRILDSGALNELEQDRTGPERERYEETVRQFVAFARQHLPPERLPLVIIPGDRYEIEMRRGGEDSHKIIVRSATPETATDHGATAPADQFVELGNEAFSTDLPQAFLTRLTDYAREFELGLGPKIARIALVTLSSHPTYDFDQVASAEEENAAGKHVERADAETTYPENIVIVRKGIITEHDWQMLQEENKGYHASLLANASDTWKYRLGLVLVAAVITVILSAYVARYQARCVRNHTRGIAMCALLLAMLVITQLAGIGSSNLYLSGITPTLLAAMILTIAYDQRFALGVATIHAFIVTAALNQGLDFYLILWTGVLTACYLLDEIRSRSRLIEVGGAAALAMICVTAAVGAVELEPLRFIANNCLYAGAAGLTAGFIALGILPFIEKTFRITTAMTLLELADASQPLLRRLAVEAPGTYSHSLQVATLAESAAEAIHGNSLACRVGSYYHDIGKINKPDYFVENQLGGPNKHLNLDPNLSLKIIIGHVKDGVEMAKEYNLPSSILPFIHQHHGTTLVEYFYHQALEKNAQDQPAISEYHFRYPGPKPKSKETAIVMICDAVESATRAMTDPTASRIEKLVHDLTLKRLLDGQFDECDMTMRDLELIERTLVKTLLGIYHGRIAYPAPAAARPSITQPSIKLA